MNQNFIVAYAAAAGFQLDPELLKMLDFNATIITRDLLAEVLKFVDRDKVVVTLADLEDAFAIKYRTGMVII